MKNVLGENYGISRIYEKNCQQDTCRPAEYSAPDGSQMAFWSYKADRVSKEHVHDYDEYMICVEGEYTVTINGEATVLHAGDELFIPKGTVQGGSCRAGTRTIHAFGGRRVK